MSIIFINRQEIESLIVDYLNSQDDYISSTSLSSTRAVGDAIEDLVGKQLENLLNGKISEYSAEFARRAMADLAFNDVNGNFYRVDVKTHRESTVFNMPNLTSVERIARFYEDDSNFFSIMMFKYEIEKLKIRVKSCIFVPIEYFSWDCLTIGALGWGQIQIANANRIIIKETQTRKDWMISLCDNMLSFYPKEIIKINKRISYFEEVRNKWINK
jgi:hypothetical protein